MSAGRRPPARRIAAALLGVAVVAVLLGAASLAAPGRRGRPATVRPGPPPRVFAFMSGAGGAALDHLRRYGSRISVLAPNWYAIRAAAGGSVLRGAPDPSVARLARHAGVAVWPVVNAHGDGFRAAPDRLVAAIAAEAARHGYAGVTLDIEQIPGGEGGALIAFVREVAARLHADGRRLAVYVPGPGPSRAYRWGALAHVADLLIVSGYDEHSAGTVPGPVTTAPFLAGTLRAAAAVSRLRVAPAVGGIGFRWPTSGGKGKLLSSIDAAASARRMRARLHGAGGDAWFASRDAVVHFQTAAALRAWAADARSVGMRWLALFSLGREPDGFWAGFATARRPVT